MENFMKLQKASTNMLKKLQYWYYKNIRNYDIEELLYLIDYNQTKIEEEDIYALFLNNYPKKTKTKKVKTIQDYKEALSKSREMKINGGKINFKKENIIGENLEDFRLTIPLEDILFSIPIKHPRIPEEEIFVHLEKTNLKGNTIIGDLYPIFQDGFPIYFKYAEDTFDDNFKQNHPKFFLDDKAPKAIKEKYYGTRYCSLITAENKCYLYFTRNCLNFEEYLKYYSFLHGKYLGNFRIESKEYVKIQLVEKLGLEETEKILKKILHSPYSIYAFLYGILTNNNFPYNPFPIEREMNTEEINQLLLLLKEYQPKK